MTLAESLSLSEFQLPHLQNGYHEWINLMWLWGVRGEGVWCTHGTQLMVATIIITVARVAPPVPSLCSQSPLPYTQALAGVGPLGPALPQSRQKA